MKTLILFISIAMLVLVACVVPATTLNETARAVAPTPDVPTEVLISASATQVDESVTTNVDPLTVGETPGPTTWSELSSAESEALLYMREEEKLAHDVYVTLYGQWGLPIFQNISNSEQIHTEAVRTLLDRYGLTDPAAGKAVGVFVNPTLQGLYDQLVVQGSQSLAAALKVGATIEELDILDLEQRVAQTDKTEIIFVYENLIQGSRNHLRSFSTTLATQTGEIYQPQYLSQAAYDTIVETAIESGGARGGQHGPRPGAGPRP